MWMYDVLEIRFEDTDSVGYKINPGSKYTLEEAKAEVERRRTPRPLPKETDNIFDLFAPIPLDTVTIPDEAKPGATITHPLPPKLYRGPTITVPNVDLSSLSEASERLKALKAEIRETNREINNLLKHGESVPQALREKYSEAQHKLDDFCAHRVSTLQTLRAEVKEIKDELAKIRAGVIADIRPKGVVETVEHDKASNTTTVTFKETN